MEPDSGEGATDANRMDVMCIEDIDPPTDKFFLAGDPVLVKHYNVWLNIKKLSEIIFSG